MVLLTNTHQQRRKQGFQIFYQAIVFGTFLLYAAVTLPNLSSLLAEIDSTHSKLNFNGAIDRSLSSSRSLTTTIMEKEQQIYERDEPSSLAIRQPQPDDEHQSSLDGQKRVGLKIVWLMSFPNSG